MGYLAQYPLGGHHSEDLRPVPKTPRRRESCGGQKCGDSTALGEFEERFLSSIGRLMIESEQSIGLPIDVMTVRHHSLTFRLLARAGSTMDALLQVPQEQFPFSLSTLLSDPTIATDLSESLNTPCFWAIGARAS